MVHLAGDRGMELPLEEHHRLQRVLAEDAVRDQAGNDGVVEREFPQHGLQAAYGYAGIGIFTGHPLLPLPRVRSCPENCVRPEVVPGSGRNASGITLV